MKIQVKSVEEKVGPNGDKFKRVQAADGRYFSCWDGALLHLLQPGAWLEVTIVEKGKYKNITTAEPASPEEAASPGEPSSPTGVSNGPTNREEAIGKQVCLKCATELAVAETATGKVHDISHLLNVAKLMYQWLSSK